MTSRKQGSFWLYRRVLEQARPYWRWTGLYLLVSLLGTPLALLLPLPLTLAVDSVLGSQPPPAWLNAVLPIDWADTQTGILAVSALVVVFAFLSQCQQMTLAWLRTVVGEKLVMGFRERLFGHVQRLSLTYHDSTGTADSIYRIQNDAGAVQSLVTENAVPLISAAVMVCSMLYVTAQVSLRLALIGLAVCPPLILATAAFRPRLRKQWREVKVLESAVQSVVQEVLGSVRLVKAFNREEHETARFRVHYGRGVAARNKAALQEHWYSSLSGMIVATGTAVVLLVGGGDVRSGELALGSLLLVLAYLKHLYGPLTTIGRQLTSRQKTLASAERAFLLVDEVTEVPERADALPLSRAVGRVSFRKVSFAYPKGPLVLSGVTFEIPAGTRVGIAGPTGAGKTTLINLLARFYDRSGGRILLDGVDLRDYRLDDLRRQFSMVLQEPVLFSTSIADNIAYGRPEASEAEIIEAAGAAGAHEFISSLPDGYKTLVGERGMRLSGGERQRISLARAFLKDAPILILDEPTSSVDPQTERGIMDAMVRLMHGRTTFMIAHRLDTLRNCEMLLRVEDGVVRVTTGEEIDRALDADSLTHEQDKKADGPTRVAPLGTSAAGDPREHAAAIAWLSLNPGGVRPTALTILKSYRKSGVYRLHDVLPDNLAVVAKLARRKAAAVERLIYEVVLPSLSLSRLDFFGAVDEGPEEGMMWLFMQDAGDVALAKDQHICAVQWLAQLHTAAADNATVRAAELPDRGLTHYRRLVYRSRKQLRALISQWAAPDRADARAALEESLALLDQLHARWATFAESAGVMPPTLAHGDFVPKNLRLGGRAGEPAVYVLNWEAAGWGSPAIDLAGFEAGSAELDAYASYVRRRWPAIDAAAVEQARRVGVVMRCITAIDSATYSLGWGWDVRLLRTLEGHVTGLRSALGPSEGRPAMGVIAYFGR